MHSRAIDREALCVIAGKQVWQIRCDMHVLDDGGNIIDAIAVSFYLPIIKFKYLRARIVNVASYNSSTPALSSS